MKHSSSTRSPRSFRSTPGNWLIDNIPPSTGPFTNAGAAASYRVFCFSGDISGSRLRRPPSSNLLHHRNGLNPRRTDAGPRGCRSDWSARSPRQNAADQSTHRATSQDRPHLSMGDLEALVDCPEAAQDVRRFRAVLRRSERMISACRTLKRFRLALYHDVTSWFAALLRTCVFRKITSLNGNETGQTSRKLRFTPFTGVLRNRGGSVVLTRERRRLRRTSRHGIGCFWLLRQWFSYLRCADHRNIFDLLFSAEALVPVRADALFSGADGAAASLSLPSETAISMDLLFSTEALVAARAGPSFSGEGDAAAGFSLASAGFGVLRQRRSAVFGCCGDGSAISGALSTAISTGLLFSAGDLSAGESRCVIFGRGRRSSVVLSRAPAASACFATPDRLLFRCCGSGSASSGALGTAISTGLLFSAGAFVPARAGALSFGRGQCWPRGSHSRALTASAYFATRDRLCLAVATMVQPAQAR